MTPNDWEEERESGVRRVKWWSDKQRAWSVWLGPSFVFGLRGGRLAEAGWLAALAPCQATHCATLPRKSPQSEKDSELRRNLKSSPRAPSPWHFNRPQEAYCAPSSTTWHIWSPHPDEDSITLAAAEAVSLWTEATFRGIGWSIFFVLLLTWVTENALVCMPDR